MRHILSPDGVHCVGSHWTNLFQSPLGNKQCQELKQTSVRVKERSVKGRVKCFISGACCTQAW